MVTKPAAPPTCISCKAPAIERPGQSLVLCAECWAMAETIATQKIRTATSAVRTLKAEQKEQEAA